MHYKNGRVANDGEPVLTKINDKAIAGTLHSTTASDVCNGQLAVTIPGGVTNIYVTVGDCYHAADAYSAIQRAGF